MPFVPKKTKQKQTQDEEGYHVTSETYAGIMVKSRKIMEFSL